MLMQESWKDPGLCQLVSTYSEMQKTNSVGQGLMCRMRNSQRQAHLETGPCLLELDLNRDHSFSPPSLRYTFHSTRRISHAANINSKQTLPLNTGVERCMEGHHPSLLQPLDMRPSFQSVCDYQAFRAVFFFFPPPPTHLLSFPPSFSLSVSVSHGGTENALLQSASSVQCSGDGCAPSGQVCTLEMDSPHSGKKAFSQGCSLPLQHFNCIWE